MSTRNGLILGVLLMGTLATSAFAVEPASLPHNSPTPGELYGFDIAACDGHVVVGRPYDGNGGSVAIIKTTAPRTIVDEIFSPAPNMRFGHSVAISRDCKRIVVGAPDDDTRGGNAGMLYWYDRVPGTTDYAYGGPLYGADTVAGDELGQKVAISPSGNTIAGGAHYKNKAYVFWSSGFASQKKLSFSNLEPGDYAGYSLSLTDNRIAVGAPLQFNMDAGQWWFGSVYIMDRNTGGTNNWGQRHRVRLTNINKFGWSVSMTGNSRRVAVGAPGHASAPGGIGPGQVKMLLLSPSGGSWSVEQTIQAPTPQTGAEFGWDVDLWSGHLAVGEPWRDAPASNDDGMYYFIAKQVGVPWTTHASIRPANTDIGDRIGWAVAVHAGYAFAGAPYSDDDGVDAGAGFIYNSNKIFSNSFGDDADEDEWSSLSP